MGKLRRLVDRVINLSGNDEITYYYDRYDDGNEGESDVVITKCVFGLEVSRGGTYKCLVARMYKGNDKFIYESEQIYRLPFIEDPETLESVLHLISKQSHSSWAFAKDI